jgi:hypothetical protein
MPRCRHHDIMADEIEDLLSDINELEAQLYSLRGANVIQFVQQYVACIVIAATVAFASRMARSDFALMMFSVYAPHLIPSLFALFS